MHETAESFHLKAESRKGKSYESIKLYEFSDFWRLTTPPVVATLWFNLFLNTFLENYIKFHIIHVECFTA